MALLDNPVSEREFSPWLYAIAALGLVSLPGIMALLH